MASKRPAVEAGRRWLLVVVTTAGAASTLRVYIWRKLRSLGALYVQQSVALLPDEPPLRRVVHRLTDRASREGGEVRMLPIAMTDPAAERAIVGEFSRERSDEYAEVCGRVPAFLAELDRERRKGRTTYTEVEESEADLARLQTWLTRISARDYFDAAGAADAATAVQRCVDALEEFERAALATELGAETTSAPATKRQLRAVEGA